MRILFFVLSAVLTLAGLTWFLEGINLIKGAAISGSSTWVYLGIMAIISGATLFYYAKSIIAPPKPPAPPEPPKE